MKCFVLMEDVHMSELTRKNGKKVIAFYLPQFHAIPENDKWWGKGFTEWTNTRKARPLFDWHYQPKTPLNGDYYCLEDVTVMERQAEMAKKYGLFGFCYYHYWFKNGKKLLELPVENMLKDKKADIPFCLCWANENWTRNWDGGNREIIMEQDYGGKKDWEKHLQYLLNFFRDDRYITYNGKPVFIIYKPEQIVLLDDMIDYWQKRVKREGFPGLVIVRQFPESLYHNSCDTSRIDYSIKFEPISTNMYGKSTNMNINHNTIRKKIKRQMYRMKLGFLIEKYIELNNKRHSTSTVQKPKKLVIRDYDEVWDIILNKEPYSDELINGAFVAWDNTARNVNGMIIKGSEPEKFGRYMSALLKKKSAMDTIFINAWNEWAEGAYLEPDEKYGYAYLEELKKVLGHEK